MDITLKKDSVNNTDMPEEKLMVERVRVLYKQVSSVLIGNIFIALLLTVFIYQYTSNVLSLYWMTVVIVLTAFRYVMLKQYYKYEREEKSVIWWGWFFAVTAFMSGCIWGATSILFLQTDDLVIMLFLLMTLTGITVGSSASLSNFVWSYYAFAIPAILPFSYVLIATGSSEFIVLSLMLSVFLLLQLVVAKKNQNTLDDSIVLRNENTELVQQLQIKNDIAESANLAKTRFLAAASHDLRQPLHAMSILLDVLGEKINNTEQTLIVEKIKKSSISLGNLLESLLDISKLDAGVVHVEIIPFKVEDVFDVLQDEFNTIAENKGLQIHFVSTTLSINSDVHIIERILRNLISNAIRYTETGKIVVGCRRKRGVVVVSVCDSGIGIEKSQFNIIFEEFHQLDNHSRDRSKGLGLGLSIVSRLTDLLGVNLLVESVPGKGSVFSIECPRNFSIQQTQVASTSYAYSTDLTEKKVIIIEDEEEISQALNLLLHGWGCNVIEITTMQDVNKDILFSGKPDIILADYRLANHVTGVDIIHAIYAHYEDRSIPAAIITGDSAPDRIQEIEKSGFKIMHKPVSGGKLRALINALIMSK